MNRFSALLQFILGFFVGVLLLVSGTASLAYVVFYRMSAPPPKPTFAEEKPKEEIKETAKSESKAQETAQETPEQSQEVVAVEEPEPEVQEEEEEDLPTGAYKASVTWPDGLSLRAEPGQEAERIGGVGYNSELIILKTSSDGDWQQVRLPGSGQEGWIKAGNIEKIETEE